jgi:hypothetical protein
MLRAAKHLLFLLLLRPAQDRSNWSERAQDDTIGGVFRSRVNESMIP